MKTVITSVSLIACVFGAQLSAQTQSCSYERCALRLQYRASGVRLVQGRDATQVARIGLFAPRVSLFANADDSTRFHYDAFREYHNRGATFGLVSLALLLGGAAAYYSTDQDSRRWPGVTLFVIGFAVSFAAGVNTRRGQDELSRTIWFYNRTLTAQ